MSTFKVERSVEAARPMLIHIQKVENSIPKATHVVYYRNYTQQDKLLYKNIAQMKEVLLTHSEMHFKVINFEEQKQPIYISSTSFLINGDRVAIKAQLEKWQLNLEGTIINRSVQGEGVVDTTLLSKRGYDQFYTFRKKYKTLENITKKVEFKIDHRLKFKTATQEYQFDLQQNNNQHFYISASVFNEPVSMTLEEISSIEDYVSADTLQTLQVDLSQIVNQRSGLQLRVTFSNMLELSFLYDFINNANLSHAQFISLRLLETSSKSEFTKIGTQHSINLHSCLKLTPLLQNQYYDYEWGYLNQNLSKIQAQDTIYKHLSKLTKSTQKYASLVNQQIIDLKKSTTLMFDVQGKVIKVPIVLVLEGINCIQNDSVSLKFMIQSVPSGKKTASDLRSDHRRVYEMAVNEIMNLSKVSRLLTKKGENDFLLKIINEEMCYFIPFERKLVNKSQFRKQSKDLAIKQEVLFTHNRQFYCLMNGPANSDQLYLIESKPINLFYLVEITSSSSLSYQLIMNKIIIFQGPLNKQNIINKVGKPFLLLLSSIQDNSKIALSLTFNQIKQVNESAATLYCFKHRMEFAQTADSLDVAYDVQIEFQKSLSLRSLRSKLSAQLKRQSQQQGFLLRQFSHCSKALVKDQRLVFTLKIRKMFYNEEMNYFDNQLIVSKLIAVNPNAETIKQGKALMLRVESECYEALQINLYDLNIQKRIKYDLEIYALKNQFLDYKNSSYKIKMPPILWQMTNASIHSPPDHFQLATHLNRRKKNHDKFQFSNNHYQEFILDHYNYNDGLSLAINSIDIAYCKLISCLKLRCEVLNDSLGWLPGSDWYFAVLNSDKMNFYLLIQRKFDPYEQKKGSQSDRSRKTVSRELSARSDKHKVDPLAKTINNLDLFKLKKKKNQLMAEERQLTAKYVKKQEKILALTRRLQQIGEEMVRRNKQEEDKGQCKKPKKQNIKMKQFYRSICQCGERNPQFKGYCSNCLKKLKLKYEAYYKEYKEKSYLYQKTVFEEFNQKRKIQRLKRKMQAINSQDIIVVETNQSEATDYFIKGLEQKGLKETIQNLKVQLFQLQEERLSLLQNSNWQMKIMQQKISRQDHQLHKSSQQFNSLKKQLSDLAKLVARQ